MYRKRKIYLRLVLLVVCIWIIFFVSKISNKKKSLNFISKIMGAPEAETKLMIKDIEMAIIRYTDAFVLIEPTVLEKIANKSADDMAFHTRQVITFGIIGRQNETWDPFCDTLQSKGVSANLTTGILGSDAKPLQSVTTHILIQHTKYVYPIIHIVVFYRKQIRFLWHGQLLLPEHNLTFAQKAGVYERFTAETHYLDGIHIMAPSPVNLFLRRMKESEFRECNVSRAGKFYEQYPKDPTDKNGALIQREGKLGLAVISKVFTRLGIPFTLSFRSLLGWYRQCDILPYGDVDIEMFATDYTPTIIEALTNAGMALTNIYGRINDSYQLSFVSSGNARFNIFMVYVEEDSFWTASVYPDDGAKFKYTFPKYPRCWTTLKHILVRVPCNSEQYILATNGQKWMDPLQLGNDGPTGKFNGYWPRDQWKDVMQSFD